MIYGLVLVIWMFYSLVLLPSLILTKACCLVENSSGIQVGATSWDSRLNVFLEIGSWHLRMWIDQESVTNAVYRREKSRMLLRNLLSPLGMGSEREERMKQVICYRTGDESGGLVLEERKKRWRSAIIPHSSLSFPFLSMILNQVATEK